MKEIVMKLVKGEPVTDADLLTENRMLVMLARGEHVPAFRIASALYEICEAEHYSCTNECPVYKVNGAVPRVGKGRNQGCSCFKNGAKMLAFLRKAHKAGRL